MDCAGLWNIAFPPEPLYHTQSNCALVSCFGELNVYFLQFNNQQVLILALIRQSSLQDELPFLRRVPFDTFTAETSGGALPPEAPWPCIYRCGMGVGNSPVRYQTPERWRTMTYESYEFRWIKPCLAEWNFVWGFWLQCHCGTIWRNSQTKWFYDILCKSGWHKQSHAHIIYIYIQIFIYVHMCGPCALNPWHQLAELIGMAMLRTEGFATGRAGGRTSAGKVTRGCCNSGLRSTEVARNSPVGGRICYTA